MNQEHDPAFSADALLERLAQLKVPPEVQHRLDERLEAFNRDHQPLAVALRPTWSQRFQGVLPRLSLAACLAGLLLGAGILLFGNPNAWAQVTQSVQAKTWVRWTMQMPKGVALPEGFQTPETWFSVKNRIGASRADHSALFVDFAAKESLVYDAKRKTLDRLGIAVHDRQEFEFFETLLRLMNEGNLELKLPDSPIEVSKRTRLEVIEEARRFIEFSFECRDPRRAPPDYRVTFRVDPQSHLPVLMRTTQKFTPNDPAVERVFAIDYPAAGPTAIYDLGVPRDTIIVERAKTKTEQGEEIQKFLNDYASARAKSLEAHEILVLQAIPEMGGNDFFAALRGKSDGKSVTVEMVDQEQLWKLRAQMRLEKASPPKDADSAQYWKTRLAALNFKPMPRGNELLPDACGHPDIVPFGVSPIDNPDCQVTLDRNPKSGPEGTVLLKIRVQTKVGFNDRLYWIDPSRDFLVLRMEIHYSANHTPWDNTTQTIDKLQKSPAGRWYATEFRTGKIEKSGDPLPMTTVKIDPAKPNTGQEIAPVTTSIFRYFLRFE